MRVVAAHEQPRTRRNPVVSQAEDAGTVASGDTAGQALAGEDAGAGGLGEQGPEDLDVIADGDTGVDGEVDGEDGEDDADDADDSVASDADEAPAEVDPADLEQETEIAADYVEGLLDVADLDGDIDMDVE